MAIKYLTTREEFILFTDTVVEQYRQIIEPYLLNQSSVRGYCRCCTKLVNFKVSKASDKWTNLLEGMQCDCGLNGRMRLILAVLDELQTLYNFKTSVVFEKLTPLYPHLLKKLPHIVGTEYLKESFAPGEIVTINNQMIRHENLMQLSFKNSSIDIIMHFDVIEHVPDMRVAFREIFRCLAPGGVMFFTCPFYHNLEKNIIRAKISDGKLVHLLEPIFHGNPLSKSGSLVFQHPTWEMVNIMEDVGFKDIKLPFYYAPFEGIVSNACPYKDGHMWPAGMIALKI